MSSFPDGFLWGAATAAHQVEGNNLNNDWWRLEQVAADKAGSAGNQQDRHYPRLLYCASM